MVKRFLKGISWGAILLLPFLIGCQPKRIANEPLRIIFDSDMGPDFDDVGALTMLHAFADSGQAQILATIASNQYELVAPCLNLINTYYHRAKVPVGAPKHHGVNLGCSQHWSDSLITRFPHKIQSNSEAQEAVDLYRSILANQPDTSVVIVTVGFMTNLSDLLHSSPDQRSTCTGLELVKKKVKRWVAMAGKFPEGVEYNVKEDSTASQYVLDHWPTPVIFSGFEIGEKIHSGKSLLNGQRESPAQQVFALALPLAKEEQLGHPSWDQTAVLTAVKGPSANFDLVRGRMAVDRSGSNRWVNDPQGKHSYLLFRKSPEELASLIDGYMMHRGKDSKTTK